MTIERAIIEFADNLTIETMFEDVGGFELILTTPIFDRLCMELSARRHDLREILSNGDEREICFETSSGKVVVKSKGMKPESEEMKDLLCVLTDLVNQAGYRTKDGDDEHLDSNWITAIASAMRLLAEYDRFEICHDNCSRWVCGRIRWPNILNYKKPTTHSKKEGDALDCINKSTEQT